VRDSIVMFDSVIRSGAVVDRAILDKEVVVGPGAIVGDGPDFDTPNKQEPGRLNTGITVVGKRAIIPRGVRIGRNVKVASDVKATDFSGRVVKSGASVEAARPKTMAGRLAAAQRAGEGRVATGAAVAVEPSSNGRDAVPAAGRAGRTAEGPVRD
jgi:ADP-glucose pyrophosphorylase